MQIPREIRIRESEGKKKKEREREKFGITCVRTLVMSIS